MHTNFKWTYSKFGVKAAVKLLTIAIITFAFAPLVSSAPDNIFGDINQDGHTDVRDVVLIQQHILGIIELSEAQLELADVSGDGAVDVQDVTKIMQHVLKLEPADREVSSLEPASIEVPINTSIDDISFPGTVQANLDDGSVKALNVEWDDTSEPPYAKDEVGEYVFEGELVSLPRRISNPEELKAQAVINVLEEDTPSQPDPDQYSLSLVVEPAQAGQASGSGDYEEGDSVQVSVEEVDPAYQFVNWTFDNNEVSSELSFAYMMPAEDITLVANFNVIDGDTFSDLDGEIAEVVVGVYNVSLPYDIVDNSFAGVNTNSIIVLHVAGKDSLNLEYNDVRDAFFKPAVQGYFEEEIENAQVRIE